MKYSTYEIFIQMYNPNKLDNKCTKFELHILTCSQTPPPPPPPTTTTTTATICNLLLNLKLVVKGHSIYNKCIN